MTDQDQPIVITDKREQKRQEAAARARAAAEAAEHPVVDSSPVPEVETTDQAMARTDRMQALRDAAQERDLSEEERAELLELQALEFAAIEEQRAAAGEVVEALTAFLVIVGHDGSARATSDVNVNLMIDREASIDDMFSGASLVVRDINAAINSKHVVFGLNVSAQAMQEKSRAMQMAQQVAGPGLAGRRR